ncbi:uncharacterized protein LOC111987239 [Quercus suber]|uniref:uncharacterized protein LOC111987239 n=1 Tax=Quercus suber TaxID=58331 RepID=UPI000CE23D42|nr:uncharacterized protein LOC111987239 [Quercus suber]
MSLDNHRNISPYDGFMALCTIGVGYFGSLSNENQADEVLFDNTPFRDFCEQLGIKNHYSSPSHLQAKGQVEVENRFLLKIIKARLEGAKEVWPDELPGLLWAYRTAVRTLTGETSFKLAYGSEAVIPAEVHTTNHKVMKYQVKENEEPLRLNLNLIDEVRMEVEQRTARIRLVLSRLGSGNVLDVDIFRAPLKERAYNTNIELDGAKVNFREAFLSVYMKVFKASSVVPVQKDGKLTRSSEVLNNVFFGLFEKGAQLIVPLLKMVKMGILFDGISLKLFNEVL